MLKCDIKKFFASIDQAILLKILECHIEDVEIIYLIKEVLSSFYATNPGIGLPLGNLTSQLLVNIYMHEFDMYVKQELRVKYYIRYADDFVILSKSKEYLEKILGCIEYFIIKKLHLMLHPDKVHIKTYASGVDFLGWVHFPDHRVLRTTTKRRMMRRLGAGGPPGEALSSYLGLLRHGNAYTLTAALTRSA